MIDDATIKEAKQADINLILDEFKWEKNKYGQIRCPHPNHNDSTPSCSYSVSRNTCKCFGCGEAFDTIDLYQCLSEKVNGRAIPFYKAVEEILELDAMANGGKNSAGIDKCNNQSKGYQSGNNKSSQLSIQTNNRGNTGSPYETIIHNSKPLTGYELNYLHNRGIMLYDSYVYSGEVYTVQNVEKALQIATDQNEIQAVE